MHRAPHDVPDDREHFGRADCSAGFAKRAYTNVWGAAQHNATAEDAPNRYPRTHGVGAVPTRVPALVGVTQLASVLKRAGYRSVTAAVAEHLVFLDPATVAQTRSCDLS